MRRCVAGDLFFRLLLAAVRFLVQFASPRFADAVVFVGVDEDFPGNETDFTSEGRSRITSSRRKEARTRLTV